MVWVSDCFDLVFVGCGFWFDLGMTELGVCCDVCVGLDWQISWWRVFGSTKIEDRAVMCVVCVWLRRCEILVLVLVCWCAVCVVLVLV